MNAKLEKLLFRIGVIDDKAGKTISRLDGQIQKLTSHATKGGAMLAGAAAGGWMLQRAMSGLLDPAIDINRALGEVQSLDVHGEALKKLQATALKSSIRYGDSAAEFIRASYDIQSAIAGLQGSELATFTEASAVLAKGTKADVSVITDYMGTMYGIFQNTAKKMGKANWVQVAAGQTATAVQMFKTTGAEMAAAFSNLGAEGESFGISMAEQMAVMGQLQATMSGSEAGTKYKSFLQGLGKAQMELGMQFTDSEGRMLPMMDILQKLRSKFGQIDTVAEADLLKKAFGRKEAVALIKQLMLDTEGLASNIQSLGNVKGMDKARQMAEEIADPSSRWSQSAKAVRIALGKAMLPILTPIIDKFTAANARVVEWSQNFPHLTKAVSGALLVIAGLIGTVITLAVVGGVLQLTMAGLSGLMLVWTAATKAATAAQWLFSAALWANPITWIVAGVTALVAGLVLLVKHWDKVKSASLGFIQGVVDWWGKLRTAIEGNGFLLLLFSPLLIGIEVIKLVSRHFMLLINNWGKVRSAIEDNAFLKFVFTPLLAVVDLVSFAIRSLMKIPEWFGQFSAWLGGLDIFGAAARALDWLLEKWRGLRAAIENNAFLRLLFAPLTAGINVAKTLFEQLDKLPQWFKTFKNWLGDLNIFDALGSAADWLMSKLRLIPGIGKLLPKETAAEKLDRQAPGAVLPEKVQRERRGPAVSGLPQSRTSAVPSGGISQQINNNQRGGNHIEEVHLHQPVSGSSFSDELEMAAG